MRILIVEDSKDKKNKISDYIKQLNIKDISVDFSENVIDGLNSLSEYDYNIVILDIQLPFRLNENPIQNGGVKFISEINRYNDLNRPKCIIGMTEYSEIITEYKSEFDKEGWVLIEYNPSSSDWMDTIKNRILYHSKNTKNDQLLQIPKYFYIGLTFLILSLIILMYIDQISIEAFFVLRIIVALSTAMATTIIPGNLGVTNKYIKASGYLAVFVLIYIWNPPSLVSKSINENVKTESINHEKHIGNN